MRSLVIYESMYGNTHEIAEAIGRGLAEEGSEVAVVPVHEATAERLAEVDLVVVGGPTHGHGMSRDSTRQAAVEGAQKPDTSLQLDPSAPGEGLREWFDGVGDLPLSGAAFDTRVHLAAALSGRASKGISKRLRHHGVRQVAEPESFFVTKENALEAREEQRAHTWGRQLARATSPDPAHAGEPTAG